MQFFEHQDQARGRTTLLVVLFSFAVLGLVVAASLATHFLLLLDHDPNEPLSLNHFKLVGTAGLSTFAVIFFGSIYRTAQLRGGGKQVAETLGGQLITPSTKDFLERRVVNVVEEMAIAAGLPVPPVYLMAREKGINAFAAGWSPDDAVIGVTRGALESLNREQLQGVIAHEFSHILNRDCALNMRLLGVLHGIVVISIIGRILIRIGTSSSSSRSSKDNSPFQFAVLGFVIWAFGALGVLIARIIQSAVSRQREYLADASAVQFTRNPSGIAGALATIGSHTSALSTPRGEETSHMLIGEPGAETFLSGLSSHPPLFERIRRILPSWDGNFRALATPPGSVLGTLEQAEAAEKKRFDAQGLARDLLRNGPMALGTAAGRAAGGGPKGQVVEAVLLGSMLGPEGTADQNRQGQNRQGPSANLIEEQPSAPVAKAARLLALLPSGLRQAAEEPFSARALILSLLIGETRDPSALLASLLASDPPLAREMERLGPELHVLSGALVLPLFDIAVGTLVGLSDRQAQVLLSQLTSVFSELKPKAYRAYCFCRVAARRLGQKDPEAEGGKVMIKDAIETVLGVLAYEGHPNTDEAGTAFLAGGKRFGTRGTRLSIPLREGLSIQGLDAAFGTLLRLPPTTRAQLLDAAETVAAHDGRVEASEAELLRAMATCLGVAAHPVYADGP